MLQHFSYWHATFTNKGNVEITSDEQVAEASSNFRSTYGP